MNTIKVETWLPLFPGFYNTLFDIDHEEVLECYNESTPSEWVTEEKEEKGYTPDETIEYEHLEIEYEDYQNAVAEAYVEFIKGKLSKYVKNITLQRVSSPKEYNFENDSIYIEIELCLDIVKELFEDNNFAVNEFRNYLKAKYTSCDGFISSYSNDVEVWINDINNIPDIENIEHKVGSILQFILGFDEDIDIEELEDYYYVAERVSSTEFCSLQEKDEDD